MAATCSPDIYETIINFGLWELFKRERNLLTEKHLGLRTRGAGFPKAIISLVNHFFLLRYQHHKLDQRDKHVII